MLMAYASVAAFFLVAIGFILGSMIAGKLIRPNNLYAEKLETYECGEAPVGPAWFNFNPRFYIIALIYIIFDVEIAFIYPVATVFKRWVEQGSGLFALVEIALFVGHPDARPRLRLVEGRSRVDPLDQGRSARRPERAQPHQAGRDPRHHGRGALASSPVAKMPAR
jgi:NADH:ubiquinone oxidoreductase subunit 3 (subunit A)